MNMKHDAHVKKAFFYFFPTSFVFFFGAFCLIIGIYIGQYLMEDLFINCIMRLKNDS